MTSKEKREKLSNELMLLAEALLEDEDIGSYSIINNELKIESSLGGDSSIHIKIKNYKKLDRDIPMDDGWDEFIYDKRIEGR